MPFHGPSLAELDRTIEQLLFYSMRLCRAALRLSREDFRKMLAEMKENIETQISRIIADFSARVRVICV
jgi:hypothetical protein